MWPFPRGRRDGVEDYNDVRVRACVRVSERERVMCIYTVSPQERGRKPGRRPDRCTNAASSHRDPLHEGETPPSCNTQRKLRQCLPLEQIFP